MSTPEVEAHELIGACTVHCKISHFSPFVRVLPDQLIKMLPRVVFATSLLSVFSSLFPHVSGHAAMMSVNILSFKNLLLLKSAFFHSIPTSRNSFDRVVDGFENGTSKSTPCTCANNGPCDMGSAREKGGGGQR